MPRVLDPFRFVLIAVAGWMNQHQLQIIDYLREENRVLREQLGGRRVRLNDDQRRRLAAKAKGLGRKLACGGGGDQNSLAVIQDGPFSAPRSQGKRASSTAMLSAVVSRGAARGGTAWGGVALRARRARWLRPYALPPRAPTRRSCSADVLKV